MEDNGRDDFDVFGSAALIEFELSQRPGTSIGPDCQLNRPPSDAEDELQKFREQLCTLEGENKYLRSVNERLDRQVKSVEDDRKKQKLLYEQESRQQHEGLKADLAFKDKEICDLTEKCKLLTDRLNQHLSTATTDKENAATSKPPPKLVHIEPRPTRKRPRPSSLGEGDRQPKHLTQPSNNNQPDSFSMLPSKENLVIACRSNAVLASKSSIDFIRGIMKNLVIAQQSNTWDDGCDEGLEPVCHEETSIMPRYEEPEPDETSSTDQLIAHDSPSFNLKLAFDSSSQPLSSNAHLSSHPDMNNSVFDCYNVEGATSNWSSLVLKSMLDMYDSGTDHPLCPSFFPVMFQPDLYCSNVDVSLMNFIENTLRSYYDLCRSLASSDLLFDENSEEIHPSDNCTSHRYSDGTKGNEEASGSSSSSCSGTSQPTSKPPPLSSSPSSMYSFSSCSSYTATSQGTETKTSSLQMISISRVFTVLNILNTLTKYSPDVRRNILNTRPSDSLLQEFSTSQSSLETASEKTVESQHGSQLVNFSEVSIPSSLSNRVILPSDQSSSRSEIFKSTQIGLHRSLYNGNIFELLLQTVIILASMQKNQKQKEETKILNGVLEILISLSEECDNHILKRYSVLIRKEKNALELLLRREDSSVTINILTLLTSISRSAANVSCLCSSSESCVVGNCYTLFTKPPSTSDPIVTLRIWTQLVRFICQVLGTEGGEKALLESSSCNCSSFLITSLLTCMVDVVHTIDRATDVKCSPYTDESYSLLLMMLTLTQTLLHHPKQREELRQDLAGKHKCLFCINTCLSWCSKPSEDILQDICQQLMSDSDEEES